MDNWFVDNIIRSLKHREFPKRGLKFVALLRVSCSLFYKKHREFPKRGLKFHFLIVRSSFKRFSSKKHREFPKRGLKLI